jgi:group II intron reverse transcriptase/maturase
VKPQGTAGAPSLSSAQIAPSSREGHNDLLERMLEGYNLRLAYKRVVQNGGAPGVDGVTVTELQAHLWTHWETIKEQLLAGTYKPAPVKRVEIPKPGGGVRMLGIPTVMDRFLQQALMQVMTPIFDDGFSRFSYGFRPSRRAHDAVRQAQRFMQEGYRWVVDMDLEKFFDRVNHDILMARVARKVKDKRVLKLIRAYLNAGVMINGVIHDTEEGTPQGGPLSPLLANILLDDLDKELERRGLRFVRYADDCNIFVASKRAGERAMGSVIRFVEGKLKLKVNREKSAVDQYITGWTGYFHMASAKKHCETLDKWIRRRLRMCLWKQWKRVRTRYRELRALGVPEYFVHMMANSRRGPWEMSRNLNNALDTSYWQAQGLNSLLERYLELRLPLGTA